MTSTRHTVLEQLVETGGQIVALALEHLELGDCDFSIPASDEAKEAVRAALARSRAAAGAKAAGRLGAG